MTSFGESIKETLPIQITDLILDGTRFSISLVEYTSSKSKIYEYRSTYQREVWNLGMQRIVGSLPAEGVVELVRQKLAEFWDKLDKLIVATVNDGASVMVNYGKLIEPEQQLCMLTELT